MGKKEDFELLNKLNILKGYLLDADINYEEVLNVATMLFKPDTINIQEILQKVKEANVTDTLNLLNNYTLQISNELFRYPCSRSWFDLVLTSEPKTKFCTDCSKNVYLVDNEDDFIRRKHLQQCVALDTFNLIVDSNLDKNFKSCRINLASEPLLGDPF